jgi:rubrerythrin
MQEDKRKVLDKAVQNTHGIFTCPECGFIAHADDIVEIEGGDFVCPLCCKYTRVDAEGYEA